MRRVTGVLFQLVSGSANQALQGNLGIKPCAELWLQHTMLRSRLCELMNWHCPHKHQARLACCNVMLHFDEVSVILNEAS